MFSIRKRESTRGFILIYVVFIVTLCIFIALNCFKLEVLKRENNLKMQKNILKVEYEQKTKEYIFTQLDEFLYKNVTNLTSDGIKAYLDSLSGTIVQYEDSHIEYNKSQNCLLVVYYKDGKFSKEELYQYRVENNSIFYTCIDYSFKEGVELKND